MVYTKVARMFIPKKIKWNSLSEFRDFLVSQTTEKIVLFEGWRLVTETTEYSILDGVLKYKPKEKKSKLEPKLEILGARPKPIKVKKLPKVKEKTKKEILEEMKARGKAALDKKKKSKR